MSERSSPTDRIERRGFLAAVAAGIGGVGATRGARGRESMARESTATYAVEQGDRCLPIVPLSGDETVAEFYDYRTPFTDPSGPAYSSYGTTDLQRPETSILFLYDGPEGLSLVVVHDKLEDGTNGGAVTFGFENLAGGEWVIGDDIYDAPSNYDRFQETEDGWKIDWTWTESRSDGGAYRPLDDDFAVTIDPGFNADAALYGDPYEGEITEWQVLSGDLSDPDRVSLSLTEPLTIRAGGCGSGGGGGGSGGGDDDDGDDSGAGAGPIDADVSVVQGRVNPRSRGTVSVVVRSTSEFDATAVNSETVTFGPGGAAPAKSTHADANGDGRADLVLKFRLPETSIDWDTETAEFVARTQEGQKVSGTADIRLVPRGGDDDDDDEDEYEEDDDEWEEDEDEEEDEDDDDDKEDEEEDDDRDDDDDDDDEEEDDESRHDERGKDDGKHPGNDNGNGRGRGEGRGKGRGRDDDE